MNGPARGVHRFAAVTCGLLPLLLLLDFTIADPPAGRSLAAEMTFRVAILASVGGALGLAWGYAKPHLGWRWGLWIGGPSLVVLGFVALAILGNLASGAAPLRWGEVALFLAFLGAAVGAPVAGGALGARLARRRGPDSQV